MCRRILVSGRVQGVGYRAFARREAAALGITVIATNLPDGRVEVIACGEADTLDVFGERLREGPKWSAVASVGEKPGKCIA